jgi:hypothetical protein
VLPSACGRTLATAIPGTSRPADSRAAAKSESHARSEHVRGPRKLNGVPPGHYPPPGQCRLWYSGRPPGHQPRPTACRNLAGRVPPGAFVLHNGRAWDADYDWRAHARRQPGSVPEVILDVIRRHS